FDHCAQLSGGELAMARLLPALRSTVDPLVILGEHGPLEGVLAEGDLPVEVLELDADLAHTHRDDVSMWRTGPATVLSVSAAVAGLARRLRELRPDLVHTNSLKAALIGGVAGRLAGVPVVWHIRDRTASDYMPTSAIHLVRNAARVLPSAIITNSDTTRRALGVASATVVPSPVDVRAIAAAAAAVGDRPDADADSDTGGRRPVRFVMVGRLSPWKGQDVFAEAFARAFPTGDETAVLAGAALFGEDDYEQQLRWFVEQLGLGDRLQIIGHVDDVPRLLADSDVLVHASTVPEPFGQVIVEGMAAGLAVVAAAVGGPAEVITEGVDGLLFPPGDVDALSVVLAKLAGDPALRERLGAAGRERAKDFTPARVAPLVEAVYRSTLGGRAQR
ncbi:MAG: glycosyltransferase family 4 protein, partial [Actinobacteria bacterium]|nr:glycosyltransferase family 4 protein [Actinomycetota bacterium]